MVYSSELHDAQVIVPHNDWRGTYDRGTTVVGSCVVYSTNGTQLAPPPDSTPSSGDQYGGGTYSGTKEHCIDVDWPAAYTWSARQYRRGYSGPDSWMGSLIFESRDASGLYYRRNRYYDSEKGRFTQEDPIGLAGGVNLYGFGNADPLTFSDSYGVDTTFSGTKSGAVSRKWWRELRAHAHEASTSENEKVAEAGENLLSMIQDAENSAIMYEVHISLQKKGWRALFQSAERCEDQRCILTFDPRPTATPITLKLAHELSGVFRRLTYGAQHTSANGAIVGENWARTIYGCIPVERHIPTPCR
jgi:RHS repeat-associated protein